ncbi:MAG TPA: GGDEF domain-containing protein [Roseomonas sp.]|nr:GGDEF domain-containing protein [Roseomonas sp.]
MQFDLFTLYAVILFVSVAMLLIWAFIALSYPGFRAARLWFAASLVNMIGGGVMALGREPQVMAPIFIGNALIILGFGLSWNGVQQFYGRRMRRGASLLLALLCLAMLFAWREERHFRQIIYAAGQSLPLFLSVALLLRRSSVSSGWLLTVAGMLVTILAHIGKLLVSGMLEAGQVSPHLYAQAEGIAVLMMVSSGLIWKLGFMLLGVEHLRTEMAKLALRDDLTGLSNRRHMLARLSREDSRARLLHRPFAVMLLDLDHFKEVNDTLGHAAGDACLCEVAKLLQRRMRRSDLAARMGGDEFCILLPDATLPEAEQLAATLVDALCREPPRWQGQVLPVTFSIGLAEWSAASPGPGALLKRADEALYEAKRGGRNGYAAAPSGEPVCVLGPSSPAVLEQLPAA